MSQLDMQWSESLLSIRIDINRFWIPESLGDKYDEEKMMKCSRDIIAGDRFTINCLSRETKSFCH
jgi:hypothetical protein